MSEIVATNIDGTPLLIEVRAGSDPELDVGILRDKSFDGVVEAIKRISTQLSGALTDLAPDKATLEFGVDIGVEAGQLTALIVKGSGSASLKIALEWEKAK